ncbi:MAG TPA: serine/threonine-protein kinase [Planctomycetota bacterium]|nr:serine/threonine-protein kinase [Planctomycetota bacterium]
MADVSEPRRDLFGDIAVAKCLLTWSQVRDILKKQVRYRDKGILIRVGELAVEMGYLSTAQVNEIIAEQRTRRKAYEVKAPKPTADIGEWQDADERPFSLGRYKLEKRLGGVMGVVFKGIDTQTNRVVAVKVLPKSLAHDPSFVERFKREVKATCQLTHPNIISVWDSGVINSTFYLAMEYIEGETLIKRLHREKMLPEKEALQIGLGVARALEHAHGQGVLHRDVKPENIMISTSGQVKLADLGLALFLHDSLRITSEGIAVGTPHYISPEQARALRNTDHRSDLYSLGATLFHVVTGRLPYEGENGGEVMKRHVFEPAPNAQDVNPAVSNDVAGMILKLMAKNPDARYQTATELAAVLEMLLGKAAK